MLKHRFTTSLFGLAMLFGLVSASAGELHIYNWSDYIAADTIQKFQKETGIQVSYDVYDTNELLETKLLAGRSGFDLVFPTARPFAGRHLKANIYQALDKSKLSNYKHLDPVILKSLQDLDAGNDYLVPYMWGTTGIGINLDKVKSILGDDLELSSWDLLFKQEVVQKLAACGVTMMDDMSESFAALRAWQGKNTADFSKGAVQEFSAAAKLVRPYIKYFHSSQYINDLANGDICVAHGYSGDILQARDRANAANNGVKIAYLVPKEGAVVWTDVMAIPADAVNVKEAHQFIDFLMRPEIIAEITNFVSYTNANSDATALIDSNIANDAGIYPPAATREKFFVLTTPTDKQTRDMNRVWTRVKTNM